MLISDHHLAATFSHQISVKTFIGKGVVQTRGVEMPINANMGGRAEAM